MTPRFSTRLQLGGATGRMFALAAAAALAEPFLAPVAFGFGLVADAVPPRVDLAGVGFSSSASSTSEASSSWPSSST